MVDALDLLDTLQLKNQRIRHEDVDTVAAVQADSLVFHRLRVLKTKRDSVQFQLVRQALLIGGFQQARPKFPVNLDRTTDHLVRQLIEFQPSCPFVLFVVKSGRFLSVANHVPADVAVFADDGYGLWVAVQSIFLQNSTCIVDSISSLTVAICFIRIER